MERRISKAGGISIPKSMRRELGIDTGEKVNIKPLEDGNLVVERIEGTCVFCESTTGVIPFKGRFVCDLCRKELGE
ncbi:MAG: AbrB/MazE/SpoVT family DNA-binding domain-containing protein [Anaerovoracaceae bacterium]